MAGKSGMAGRRSWMAGRMAGIEGRSWMARESGGQRLDRGQELDK